MLTKIQIKGYKSLRDARVNLNSLTVFLGKNNVGKSNLFDALRLVSNLAKMPVIAAFAPMNHRGDPNESFFKSGATDTLSFVLDLNLSAAPHPYKKGERLTHVFFQYEVHIRYSSESGSLTVISETLSGRTKDGKKSKSFIEQQGGKTIVNRDIGSGNNRKFDSPANRSVLLMIDDAELYPSVCAVREELASWKFFHFEPQALREPSQKINIAELETDGRGLSGFYDTLSRTDAARFEAAKAGLRRAIPEAKELDTVETGDNRKLLRLIRQDGEAFTARVMSDGTLRFLALLALAHAPSPPRLVCFEEPENGVHPSRLKFTVDALRAIAAETEHGAACQVLVNSHSPYLVDQLNPDEVVLVVNEKGETRFQNVSQELFADKPFIKTMLESGEQTLGEVWAAEGLDYVG
ncbi:MAG: AAA family ATPase [Chloroherpetonaceae bacterium]